MKSKEEYFDELLTNEGNTGLRNLLDEHFSGWYPEYQNYALKKYLDALSVAIKNKDDEAEGEIKRKLNSIAGWKEEWAKRPCDSLVNYSLIQSQGDCWFVSSITALFYGDLSFELPILQLLSRILFRYFGKRVTVGDGPLIPEDFKRIWSPERRFSPLHRWENQQKRMDGGFPTEVCDAFLQMVGLYRCKYTALFFYR